MSIAAAALARAYMMRMPTLSRQAICYNEHCDGNKDIVIRIKVFWQDRKMTWEITWEII